MSCKNMNSVMRFVIMAVVGSSIVSGAFADSPGDPFREVARDETGGHYFSQVIYAPTIKGLVSWGTKIHSKPIRDYETQHYEAGKNRWINAFPRDKAETWSGKFKKWAGWGVCSTNGEWYERDGVKLPRPNSSFYQVCWDDHNERLIYYLGSMTFSYDPATRAWKSLHAPQEKQQPPALLLWSSLCYDPINKQVLLFGGGGIDAPDGRPHTWVLDVTTDRWRKLDLDVEPPARCNSRMVYDRRHKLIVLFGGDGQDRALADTWVFDVEKQEWQERRPPLSPHPRSCHAMTYLDKSGVVLLVGGVAVADYRDVERLSRQAWIYDAGNNIWTPLDVKVPKAHWMSMENIPGTDEVILVTANRNDHGRVTWRFRYDQVAVSLRETKPDPKTVPRSVTTTIGVPPGTVAFKTHRTKAWYEEAPPAEPEKHKQFLTQLPTNQWVEAKPPRSTPGRTWGTALFDTDLGVAMKWGGGHSGYQGTDMAFYDVAKNRFTIDRSPAFTPEPFQKWARRPAGRTFFSQPWTRHMRHTCAYDRVRKLGIFSDTGGSAWFDRDANAVFKHTWLYDPAQRRWLEPILQPFPGGSSVSPIAVPTPRGVIVYQHAKGRSRKDGGQMHRFVGEAGKPDTWGWEEIDIVGSDRPHQWESMSIVYDQKRDRLIFLSHDAKTREPVMWFFSMQERRWTKNPQQPSGGVSTREAVYLPDADAILAYGPAKKGDPVWTRVYLCAENRWVPLAIETPQYLVHEVALEYDPIHKLAVLLWPPKFEQEIRPHLFRFDASKLPKR